MSEIPHLQIFPHGKINELHSMDTSALLLLDYDEKKSTRLLGLGRFAIHLAMTMPLTHSNFLVTFCSINGFQWPLTRDTFIVRVGKCTFVIALPGLLYGLHFPPIRDEAPLDTLGRVFKTFGHYRDAKDTNSHGPVGYSVEERGPFMWEQVRLLVEPMANEILTEFGRVAGRSRFGVSDQNSCLLRAARMSATTKLVIDGLVNGTLLGEGHIIVQEGPSVPAEEVSMPYASVSAFSCVVDAVEAAWVTSCGLVHLVKPEPVPAPLGAYDPKCALWKLNEKGIVALIQLLGPAAEREEQILKERDEAEREKQKDEARTSGNDDKDK